VASREKGCRGIALIQHAGSGNHGCEAIVRGLLENAAAIAGDRLPPVTLITHDAAQDRNYLPGDLCEIVEERHMDRNLPVHAGYWLYRKLTGDRESFLRYRFPMLARGEKPELAVSIGGDNYCYPEMVPDLILTDRMLRGRGVKTLLLGCSVEADMLRKDAALAEDMRGFDRIIARESLSRDALLAAGVAPERLVLLPDPAFSMEPAQTKLPHCFEEGEVAGINLSPLIGGYGDRERIGAAYEALIRHILDTSKLQIALIPHVVWPSSDDREPLGALYRQFSGSGRVTMVTDRPAPELKQVISRCAVFVGARTHATIAAYSTLVPTLVVGYSVKSEGIARDLFGQTDGYVLRADALTENGIIDAFEGIRARSEEIRGILGGQMPQIVQNARKNARELLIMGGGIFAGEEI
jgi:polysaccharide pyruvyl transferase WcaK-like protein